MAGEFCVMGTSTGDKTNGGDLAHHYSVVWVVFFSGPEQALVKEEHCLFFSCHFYFNFNQLDLSGWKPDWQDITRLRSPWFFSGWTIIDAMSGRGVLPQSVVFSVSVAVEPAACISVIDFVVTTGHDLVVFVVSCRVIGSGCFVGTTAETNLFLHLVVFYSLAGDINCDCVGDHLWTPTLFAHVWICVGGGLFIISGTGWGKKVFNSGHVDRYCIGGGDIYAEWSMGRPDWFLAWCDQ